MSAIDEVHSGKAAHPLSRWRRLARTNRRGVAVVEFAVVAPVFFLFVFGMIEFGRMVMVQQIITNAAREGTRVGILPGATTSQVTTAVNNYLAAGSISGATVTVNPSPPSSAAYGSSVTVTVSIPFTSVSWTPAPFFLGSTTLNAQCIMRTEQASGS
jgi:Flp pilus assembly protein TadG